MWNNSVPRGSKNPEYLRGTLPRMQLATKCLALKMTEAEVAIVSKFMGHDVHIHKEYYQKATAILDVRDI